MYTYSCSYKQTRFFKWRTDCLPSAVFTGNFEGSKIIYAKVYIVVCMATVPYSSVNSTNNLTFQDPGPRGIKVIPQLLKA